LTDKKFSVVNLRCQQLDVCYLQEGVMKPTFENMIFLQKKKKNKVANITQSKRR
jgi:hypothetical protein